MWCARRLDNRKNEHFSATDLGVSKAELVKGERSSASLEILPAQTSAAVSSG